MIIKQSFFNKGGWFQTTARTQVAPHHKTHYNKWTDDLYQKGPE
ncbi:hypothetical protein JOD43_004247 [Pullulanibacillus pueri]|nr:hypothetical protein [Pullulanibacillus pueri]